MLGELDIQDGVQTVFSVGIPIEHHLWQSGFEALYHLRFQAPDVRLVGRHVGMGDVKGSRQPHDARHILCAATQHALLPPAHNQAVDPNGGVHVQEACSFGSVKFVRTAGQEIHIQLARSMG